MDFLRICRLSFRWVFISPSSVSISAIKLSILLWSIEISLPDPLREYRTPKKLSKLTPEVIHEQETNPKREQEVYS